MQTAAQYFKAKGRKEGVQKGLEKGLEKGLAEGRRRERQRQTRFLRSTIERVLAKRADKLSDAQRRVLAKAELGTLESMLAALIDQRPLRTVFKS